MRNVFFLLLLMAACTEVRAQTDSVPVLSGNLDTVVVCEYDRHGKLSKTTTWIGSDFRFTEDFYIVGDVPASQWDSLEAMRASGAVERKFDKDGRIKWEEKIVKEETVWHRDYYYGDSSFGYEQYDPNAQPKGILITHMKVVEFFPDSTPRIIASYVDRKREGAYLTYYQNGSPQCICYYTDGKRHGMQRTYYENGNPSFIGNYSMGEMDGVGTRFYENGNPESVYTHVKGSLQDTTYDYYENGQLWTVMVYRDGKPLEVISEYDEKGNPRPLGTLKNGNGTVHTYNKDGSLYATDYYKDGRKVKTMKVK